jgi:cell fate (sporulation/competence/biofilm development) regulator YmcA (YheA/YmcA/DUF963 family)
MSTQKYSRQDAIDALECVAEQIGKSPTVREYRRNKTDEGPSVSWIKDNFGCWNNAKELAELDVNACNEYYDKRDCIDAIQWIAEEIDKSPTYEEYRKNRKRHHPSLGCIQDNLGSWNNAKELAELDVYAGSDYYDKRDCIDAIQWVAEEINKSPSIDEYDKNKKDHHPSIRAIGDTFGSWNDAKDATGLKLYCGYDQKEKKSFIKSIKSHLKCKECGFSEPRRKLHFHHVKQNTKVDEISSMMDGGYSLQEIKDEVKKCKILCLSCHASRHTKFTEEECIDALQSVANQLGHVPTTTEYKRHIKENQPSVMSVIRRFNSWSNAKETVNVESTQTTLQSDFESPSRNDA